MLGLKDIVVVGLDLSANGAGMVALSAKDGKIKKIGYVTNVKKFDDVDIDYNCSSFHFQPKMTKTKIREAEDREVFKARRRHHVSNTVIHFIDTISEHLLVCIEGYAISSQSTALLEMAEISGIVRNHCWKCNYASRIHDPTSVKLWAINYGFAKKIHMVRAARSDGFKIPEELLGKGSLLKKSIDVDGCVYTHDYLGPGTDLADAYHLACMARYEILVQRGLLRLDELTEGQRRVFLRTTKVNPLNLLSIPFIVANGDNELVGNGTTEGEF